MRWCLGKSGQRLKIRTQSRILVNDQTQKKGQGRDASKEEEVIRKVLIQGEKAKCGSSQARDRRVSKTEHQISKRISENAN